LSTVCMPEIEGFRAFFAFMGQGFSEK